MLRRLFAFLFLIISIHANSQSVPEKIRKAYEKFVADEQMKNGISSLYVVDAETGKAIFDRNSRVGLAPASTQKIITSVSAFEMLGADYKFTTRVYAYVSDSGCTIVVRPSGDPTFGSWRWEADRDEQIIKELAEAIRNTAAGAKRIQLSIDLSSWDDESIPDGWIWEDIGNYYGAGASGLNWRENQYDLVLRSGKKVGDPVQVIETRPKIYGMNIVSLLRSAPAGTGDNAYIYHPFPGNTAVVRGTIPVNEDRFRISGSFPSPQTEFAATLVEALEKEGIKGIQFVTAPLRFEPEKGKLILSFASPDLGKIIYWFNRKSINLYGEALVKTFAFEKQGQASTDSGVAILKRFWKEKGISENELNLYDGSGLSPLNRVTTHAQVEILRFARGREWFPTFYQSLPEFNNMKMKSGTISDVKGYCGYHRSKNGKEYVFSFLVNNYSGRSSSIISKMYDVLDVLK